MPTTAIVVALSLLACFDEDPTELSDEVVAQAIQDVEAARRFALARDAERDRPLADQVGADTLARVQALSGDATTPLTADLSGTWTGTLSRPGWTADESVERVAVGPGLYAVRSVLEMHGDGAPGHTLAVVQQRGAERWSDGQLCRWFDWHQTAARDPELEWTLFSSFAEDRVNGRPCFPATVASDGTLSFVDGDDRWQQRRAGDPSP
ncbi:MAG: hypothetical protein H6742_13425 [Alphaproteobacteria bacterium]|nr:hypothetical protein [Alphaproteobacteria bacterium]